VLRVFVDTWLRDKLVPPLKTTFRGEPPAILNHAEILSQNVVGHTSVKLIGGHAQLAAPSSGKGSPLFEAVYQPASHFWPLQLTETGLFLGLAAVLIGFAAWWTHERTV
jgi:hypothetical protein